MINFFRKARQRLRSENQPTTPAGRFSKYILYAIGEILLVVFGILIAIQIDDWNRDKELNQAELDSYQLIITDLKRDSLLFVSYQNRYNSFLDSYFKLNDIKQGRGSFTNVIPDFLVSNVQFNPVTKNNHQVSIEKFRNREIREQINNYFGRINLTEQATQEFNDLIAQEARPYFLKEQEILNNEKIFDNEDRTFPPFKGVTTVDTIKLKRIIQHPYFSPILSQLRMGIGFYLISLEHTIEENQKLIKDLEKNLE